MTIFEQVKSELDMQTVCEAYGLHVNRSEMILCPFHNEITPSAKIYGDNFHCFGCGEHHDVIGFTQKLFQFPNPQKSNQHNRNSKKLKEMNKKGYKNAA